MKKLLLGSVSLFLIAMIGTTALGFQEGNRVQEGEVQQERDKTEAVQADTLTVHIHGVDCDRCSEMLTKALKEAKLEPVGDLTVNAGGPSEITVKPGMAINLAEVAKKISEVKTPHMDSSPPGISLVLYAPANSIDETAAMEAIDTMKGIEIEQSKANSETGEIHIRLSGAADNDAEDVELTVNGIVAKLRLAGINAKPSKSL